MASVALPLGAKIFASFNRSASWSIAWLATAILGFAGIGVVVALFMFPAPIEYPAFPVLDKRWILASFGLAILLVYAPLGIKRIADILRGEDRPAVWQRGRSMSRAHWAIWIALAAVIGFLVAALDIGPLVPYGLTKPITIVEEGVHLGSLQAIQDGAIPYVDAQAQYGIGHQVTTYALLKNTEFSLRGFRATFFALNILAQGFRFAIMLIALGPVAGVAGILGALHFYDPVISNLVGWGYLFRWFAPLMVGAVLPLIIWHDVGRWRRSLLVAAIGAVSGTLAWFSQENFTTGLATGSIVIFAAFARSRMDIKEGLLSLAIFAAAHVLCFLGLIFATVGAAHTLEAVRLCFYVGSLWAKGLANTPWSNSDSPWTAAFYATPYIAIALSALALYAPRQARLDDERKVGAVIGMCAATASLVPITLLRSDVPHFLGPSLPLPALLAAAVVLLPGRLAADVWRREAIRAGLLIAFAFIYVMPHGANSIVARFKPNVNQAQSGLLALREVISSRPRVAETASFFERRLGFPIIRGERCCALLDLTFAELSDRIQEVRETVNGRSVFVDSESPFFASLFYFFGGLNVAASATALISSVWVGADSTRVRADMERRPPQCVMTWNNPPGPMTAAVLAVYGTYSTEPIRDGFVFCARTGS